jgi:hypothetical protein
MKASSYVAARASGVASLFLPIRPPPFGAGAGSADYQIMGGETYTYLTMISKYLREGTRTTACALLRYGKLREHQLMKFYVPERSFMYVTVSC